MNTAETNTKLIVDSAIDLFKNKGFFNVSVNEICKKANVQRCTFYNLFSNKDDIIMYILSKTPKNYENTLSSFIEAENDLECIWILFDSYVKLVDDLGLELVKAIFIINLQHDTDILGFSETYKPWFISLVRKCQKTGIIRNQGKPEVIVPMAIKLSIQTCYEWCGCNGNFSLTEKIREINENFYDIAPEYRKYS